MLKLELNEQEINGLLAMASAACKTGDLGIAEVAVHFRRKIDEAAKAAAQAQKGE